MKRRNFLKSLISAGVMLSPVSVLIENFPFPGVSEGIAPEAAFDRIPYSILIKNMSNRIIEKVDILGSAEYINHSGFAGLNKLLIDDVEISSLTEGKSYLDILYDMMYSPASIDKMVVERSGPVGAWDMLKIIGRDGAGTRYTIPMTRFKDPYEGDGFNCICVESQFWVDCMTKIVFENLQPGETIAVRLYPKTDIASIKYELPEYLKNHAELLRSKN